MTRKVVVWQPVYYPKLHYLARLNEADVFVIFDTAEFSRQSRQHRARIDYGGLKWLTIPIRHTGDDQPLKDVEIDMSQYWPKKHRKTLQTKYGKPAPEPFTQFYDSLGDSVTLDEFTTPLLNCVLDVFDIDIEVHRATEIDVPYHKNEPSIYLARLSEHFNAGVYFCGQRAYENYVDPSPFHERDIDIKTQDWSPKWERGNTICLDAIYGADEPAAVI